jgi:hypothetical protein
VCKDYVPAFNPPISSDRVYSKEEFREIILVKSTSVKPSSLQIAISILCNISPEWPRGRYEESRTAKDVHPTSPVSVLRSLLSSLRMECSFFFFS